MPASLPASAMYAISARFIKKYIIYIFQIYIIFTAKFEDQWNAICQKMQFLTKIVACYSSI
jgi:hypothetical protein